jgi:hypothetical protein
MQAARLLIEEKRYETARELLKGLTNRQAVDWMLKLDSMTPKRRRGNGIWAWVLVVILALVCAILIFGFGIRERDNNMRLWQAQRFDANILLTAYCDGGIYDRTDACTTLAANILNTDISLTDQIVSCVDWNSLSGQLATDDEFKVCMGKIAVVKPTF